jgi:predicted small metal-binding protein
MKRKLLAALLTSAAALSLATLGVSEEKAKPAESKDAPLYSGSCPSPCDFSVKGHDKTEVATIMRQHAKAHHNMDISQKDAEDMVSGKGKDPKE